MTISYVLCVTYIVMLARCQSELRAKLAEFTEKFTASTGSMESSIRETIIQEAAADRIREIAAVQKKVRARVKERRKKLSWSLSSLQLRISLKTVYFTDLYAEV